MTPKEYPAICTISEAALRDVREAFTDDENEDWTTYVDDWPPRDDLGNAYPIWFTVDDVNDEGRLEDKNGHGYSPWAGNLEPQYHPNDEYCNVPLNKWRLRYADVRYCRRRVYFGTDVEQYCETHQAKEYMKSAEEHVQTGLFTETVGHLYEDLSPWKKLMAWGTFESLMGESTYEFAPEQEAEDLDFSEQDIVPDGVDEEGRLEVEFSYPTDHVQPAQSLYVAAMQQVTMMQVQSQVLWEGQREDGTEEGVMETRSVEKAQLTAPPSEHDSSPQVFKTIETWNEHHLNLPLSRLIKDQPRLLEMGGVSTDPDDDSEDYDTDDIVLEIDATGSKEDAQTDPTAVGEDMTSQSDTIAQHATGDDDT